MKRTVMLSLPILAGVLMLTVGAAQGATIPPHPVDLNLFAPFPAGAVTIAADGSWAKLNEDPVHSPISLGHPGILLPGTAVSLSFDYSLVVAPENKDYFDFYAQDISSPAFEAGGKGGTGGFTTSGHFSYDLAGLAGSSVAVIFNLAADWTDSGTSSLLTISNLQINVVPIPGAFWLFGSGLAGMLALRARKRSRT